MKINNFVNICLNNINKVEVKMITFFIEPFGLRLPFPMGVRGPAVGVELGPIGYFLLL